MLPQTNIGIEHHLKQTQYKCEAYIQDCLEVPKELLQMWPDLPRNEKRLPGASDFSG